jgi:hypothetical protein
MKKSTFTQWFTVWLLALGFLWWAGFSNRSAAATGKAANAPAADPRLDMVTALQAMGPHPSLGDQAKVFGRFVGTWDVEYTDFSKDGKVTHRSGELMVGWVMDGRAIQDLWIVNPSGAGKEREVYRICAISTPSLEPGPRPLLTRSMFQSLDLLAAL